MHDERLQRDLEVAYPAQVQAFLGRSPVVHAGNDFLPGVTAFLEVDHPVDVVIEQLWGIGLLNVRVDVHNALADVGQLPLLGVIGCPQRLDLLQQFVAVTLHQNLVARSRVWQAEDKSTLVLHHVTGIGGCLTKESTDGLLGTFAMNTVALEVQRHHAGFCFREDDVFVQGAAQGIAHAAETE